jgi:two-component system phosphate regulon sensor histidine kinase PhoR
MPAGPPLPLTLKRSVRANTAVVAVVVVVGLIAAGSATARLAVFVVGVVALFVGKLIGRRSARAVQARIAGLAAAADAIARGLPGTRASVVAGTEPAELAAAINGMATAIETRHAGIERDRAELVAILTGMPEGLFASDRDGRVVHMNDAAGELLDFPPPLAIGRPVDEVVRMPAIVAVLNDAVGLGQEATAETPPEAHPRRRRLEIRALPLVVASGSPSGAVAVVRDVTELRHLEQVRSDFVANVSHELKTPVTAIRGVIETIVDDPSMPPETLRDFLAKVLAQAMRLSEIVSDLLTLARAESRSSAAVLESIDVCDTVRTSLAANAPGAAARQIAIDTVIAPRPVQIRAEAELLRQVVDNLLTNAIRYTPIGGQVTVRVYANGPSAVLEVEDTGIGIPAEMQARIFERFFRIDRARSRELGGTGLGLAIVRHVVEAHGGTIAVESEPGRGALFRVALPLLAPPIRA